MEIVNVLTEEWIMFSNLKEIKIGKAFIIQ